MRPLQVWLPNISGSLAWPEARRDRDRAYQAWRGEKTIWFSPELEMPFRWTDQGGVACLALPSEHWERVEVYHVGANGAVWGADTSDTFPNGKVDGLLDAWLNLGAIGGVKCYPQPEKLVLEVPRIEADKVTYEMRELHVQPGAVAPMGPHEEQGPGAFTIEWPPPDDPLPSVSAEEESHELYGPFDPAEDRDLPIAVRRSDKTQRALRVMLEWPEPLKHLIPPGTGLDDLHASGRMSRIAHQSRTDLDAALSAARLYSADYLTDGETTTGAAWFGPILAAEGEEGALSALEVRYGLAASSIDEASETDAWREIVMRPFPIRRAWGATGLLYGLMLDRLEQGRGFNACERCGRVLQGKRGKRFCARADDIECFKARRAADRRKERYRQART